MEKNTEEPLKTAGGLYRVELFFSKRRMILIPAAFILFLAVPLMGFNQYILRIFTVIGIYIILSLALNLVAGYTGQLSMGNAAFYAIGAYTATLLLLRGGVNYWLTIPLAAVLAGFCGLLLGLPTFRLRGSYLTIVTLGFGEIVRMILMNWDSVTNGTLGIRNIPAPDFFGITLSLRNGGFYYLVLFLVVLVSAASWFIVNSKIGRAFVSIREDEIAAQMMGIRTTKYKALAFVLSAFFSGLAGAFYAPMVGYIDSNSFTFEVSSQIISMAILGGLGTMRGMFFGAAVLIVFPEVSRFLMDYRFVIYGVILVLMMRFRPQGLLGWQPRVPVRFSKTVRSDLMREGILPEGE
ncbi:MAG: branched-chain amino acid ABC transporter permease [Spirochaetales bacterium]|jgi:branched-chain amino acid transport system permease protein|nr:branched-chain amino acid ABC transporter permease [Spirochaetales bacterium]